MMKTIDMKHWILAAGLTAMALAGQAQDNTVNDPNARVRKTGDFHGVEVAGAIELFISQGPETKVAISAKDVNDIEIIETEVEDGVLKIHYKDNKNWWNNQWNTMGHKFRAYVSAPNIQMLSSSGSGGIHIMNTIKGEELKVELAGSGNIEGSIHVAELSVDQSGSSNIRLKGVATKADFECSGSGNVYSPDLVTDHCELEISGSGNAEITANKEISAEISGSGNVRYKGTASIANLSTAGTGKIRKVDSF
jgi:hypothetical protein